MLTPNSGAALLDDEDTDDERGARLVDERYGAVVSVRGFVAAPDGRLSRDEAGDVGLGTSGSGDVPAGVRRGAARARLLAGAGGRVGAAPARRRR